MEEHDGAQKQNRPAKPTWRSDYFGRPVGGNQRALWQQCTIVAVWKRSLGEWRIVLVIVLVWKGGIGIHAVWLNQPASVIENLVAGNWSQHSLRGKEVRESGRECVCLNEIQLNPEEDQDKSYGHNRSATHDGFRSKNIHANILVAI